MKNKKGITLIALIITIIVMLILVGVTINIAINGGLFDTARKASQDMQIEADRERLTSADLGSLDSYGYVDFNKLDNNLPDGFTKVGERTYKSAKENVFVVNENGEVINPKLNEYGFYCNMVYETNLPGRWQEETVNTRTILVIDENNNMTISTWADTNTYEGVYVPRSLDDLGGYIVDQQGGANLFTIESVKFNERYYGYNSWGLKVTVYFDSAGDLHKSFSVPGEYVTIDATLRNINVANSMNGTYSADGKNINIGPYEFIADI